MSEEREAKAANEHGAISVPAARSVRVRFKIVIVGAGVFLQVRVEAFPEKIVILIQQTRETDLDYLYLIAGGREGRVGHGRILIIDTITHSGVNEIYTSHYST